MGAIGNPKTWIPYINSRECSKQICTLSCPQWCYIIFTPPPPPPPLLFDDKPQNRITFSPLVIAIIGILASALLLVSYYAIVSKYCGNSRPSTTIEEGQPSNEEIVDEGNNNNNTNYNESNEFLQYEPWFISTNGLDEALIKSITMVKYKKGEGLVDSVDCLVCLGEFIEGDYLRLLPKCTHAFHVNCIDTWLKSHSTCPLCRANVVSVFVSHIQPASTLVVDSNGNDNNNQGQVIVSLLDNNHVGNEEMSSSREGGMSLLKCPFRSFSHLARLELRHNEHVPNDYKDGFGRNDVTRRSISMDNFNETSVSISDIWRLSHGKDHQGERLGNCSTSS